MSGNAVAAEEAPTAPRFLFVYMMSLMLVPGFFTVAGINLTLYKILLMLMCIPLALRWVRGRAGPVSATDILIIFHIIWVSLAVISVHGTGRLFTVAASAATTAGAYLVGRVLIRNATDFRLLFKYLLIGLVILLPFALIEFVTSKNLLTTIFGKFLTVPGSISGSQAAYRFGFLRAKVIFDHPILYGLFSGMGLGVVVYVFRESLMRQLCLAGFIIGTVFLSISTGPLLGVALQLLMIIWDRMLRFVKARWLILAFLGVMLVAVMTVGMQFDIEDFLVNTLAFDPISAAARFDIFRYGMREIAGSPVFGIGFNDWTRPFWKGGSFDNFWLLIAMRYGIPALVFLVAAVGYNCLRIASRTGLTDQESSYRTGYLISMAGVAFVLGSVHIWGHAEIFVTTFIGAGSWFYTSPVILQRAEAERRRRMHRPQAPSLRPQDPAGADAVPAPAGFRSARTAGAGGSDRTIPFTTRAPGAAHSR